WLDRSGGAPAASAWLADLAEFPTPESAPGFYVDYGEAAPFTPKVGRGRAAAGPAGPGLPAPGRAGRVPGGSWGWGVRRVGGVGGGGRGGLARPGPDGRQACFDRCSSNSSSGSPVIDTKGWTLGADILKSDQVNW